MNNTEGYDPAFYICEMQGEEFDLYPHGGAGQGGAEPRRIKALVQRQKVDIDFQSRRRRSIVIDVSRKAYGPVSISQDEMVHVASGLKYQVDSELPGDPYMMKLFLS